MANHKTKEQDRAANGQFGSKSTAVDDAEKFVKDAFDNVDIPIPDEPVWTDDEDEEDYYGYGGDTYRRHAGRKGKKMSHKHAGMSALFWLVVIVVALAMVH